MTGIIKRLFGGRNAENEEYAKTVAYAQLQARGSGELEKELSLGVKDQIVTDKGAMSMFDSETFDYTVKKGRQGEGDILVPIGPNYEGQSMRLFMSPKLGLGNIDAKEAKRELLLAEREMINIELNGNEYDYDLGKGSRFTAMFLHFRQSIIGSIEGKTMRNLLITPNVTRVETGEISKEKRSYL